MQFYAVKLSHHQHPHTNTSLLGMYTDTDIRSLSIEFLLRSHH